jgi:hypothetical protein
MDRAEKGEEPITQIPVAANRFRALACYTDSARSAGHGKS